MRGDVDGCRSVGCEGDEGERRGGAGGVSDEERDGVREEDRLRAGHRAREGAWESTREGVGEECVRQKEDDEGKDAFGGGGEARRAGDARGERARDGAAARAELARHRGESSGDARPQREGVERGEVRGDARREHPRKDKRAEVRAALDTLPRVAEGARDAREIRHDGRDAEGHQRQGLGRVRRRERPHRERRRQRRNEHLEHRARLAPAPARARARAARAMSSDRGDTIRSDEFRGSRLAISRTPSCVRVGTSFAAARSSRARDAKHTVS